MVRMVYRVRWTVNITAWQGNTQITNFTIGTISSSNNISVSNTSKSVSFSVSSGATIGADSGTFTIPVTVGTETVNKTVSWACSKQGTKGDTGNGIKEITRYYLATSAKTGVTTSTSGFTTTIQTTTETDKYLWSYEVISYTNSSTSTSSPCIIGTYGEKGDTGATGAAGKDAIVVSITTSNGTVFKNNSGSTVLTAHVYVGGVEQTITSAGVCGSYGTIKWYKGTSTTAVATASTLTVKASDVDNAASYTCQLEG